MFNIQPGQGLGFGVNKEIALGLGYSYIPGIIMYEDFERKLESLSIEYSLESITVRLKNESVTIQYLILKS